MSTFKRSLGVIKTVYNKNKDKIIPWVNFSRSCIQDATVIPTENPRIIDYIDFGFRVKDNWSDNFSAGRSSFFANKEWRSFFTKPTANLVFDMIRTTKGSEARLVAKEEEGASCYVIEIAGIKIGWSENNGNFHSMYIENNKAKEHLAYKAIEVLFKATYPFGKIVIFSNGEKLEVEEDKTQETFIKFKKCSEYSTEIKKYWEKGYNRSILFFGPPGSGKSNLIKGIVSELDARTLKFNGMDSIDQNSIIEIIRGFAPDCIIFEDIDHARVASVDFLLGQIEQIAANCKLILASANEVSKLDNAVLRPGRFDQPIEISRLDDEVILNLVKNDKELFEITKDFPVAYIQELMKRVNVEGKEKAIKSIEDLRARVDNLYTSNYSLRKDGASVKAKQALEEEEDYEDDD